MEFKTPTIEDKEEIDRCILADDTRSCDYATANIILWSPFYQVKYVIIDGLFVSHTDEEGGSFCYPLGKGNKKKVLQYFMDDCKEKKIPFVLHGVTHEMEEEFREIFGDIYEIEYDRDISEYIYDRENSQHYQERNFMEREITSIVLKKIMNGPMNHFPMKTS